MHAHASDSKLTEIGSAKFFVKSDGSTVVQKKRDALRPRGADYTGFHKRALP